MTPTTARPAVACEDLSRTYVSRRLRGKQETVALSGVSIEVAQGIAFGVLGPNGAGKTTLVRILSTLLLPTAGRAEVLGFDVARQPVEVRKHIGLCFGGERGLYGHLSGRENLQYFGALDHLSPRQASANADALLALVGLSDRAGSLVNGYSRGMKQRLHIARALITDPQVVFMDEPTIGLDPMAAQTVRGLVKGLAEQGKTVLLTTHYMMEADELCRSIAIIDKGRVVVSGPPAKAKTEFATIDVADLTLTTADPTVLDRLRAHPAVKRIDTAADGPWLKATVHITKGAASLSDLTQAAGENAVTAAHLRTPTLEEAYLSIFS